MNGLPCSCSLNAWTRSTSGALSLSFRVPASLCDLRWYRNLCLLSIDYGFRPRLRTRLTLSGRPFLRKPWIFGGQDSHLPCATHANILSRVLSTVSFNSASACTRCSPTILLSIRGFGIRFQPRSSSAQGHSTSELLRTL